MYIVLLNIDKWLIGREGKRVCLLPEKSVYIVKELYSLKLYKTLPKRRPWVEILSGRDHDRTERDG